MKKKILGMAAVCLLTIVMVQPVAASDWVVTKSNLEITYKQDSSWVISIPATTLSQDSATEQTVDAQSVNIRPDQKLQVRITGLQDGKVTLTRDDGKATTTSTVMMSDVSVVTDDTVVAEYVDQSVDTVNGTDGKVIFSAIDEGTKAGNYSGTITYQMSAVDR